MSAEYLVEYACEGNVARLYLNDPSTLNALSLPMTRTLIDALDRAEKEARAIVLSGRGRAFSSGANLADGNADINDPTRDLGAPLETVYNPAIKRMRDLSIPIVTAVRGPAAGIGCSVALMGDIIVASKDAYFLQAFSNIGLIPDGGSPYILARAIGRVRAMEMMLLGERLPADEAFKAGLITRLVDDAALDDTAMEYAQKLAAGPTKALGLIRQSAWAALDSSLEDQLDRERALQRDAGRTHDMVEGIMAFLQKRAAKFTGK